MALETSGQIERGEPSMRFEPASKKRIHIIEAGKKRVEGQDVFIEHALEEIREHIELDLTELALDFIDTVNRDRRGCLRTLEAGIQKQMLRAFYKKPDYLWQKFKRAFSDLLLSRAGTEIYQFDDDEEKGSIEANITKIASIVFAGIEGAMKAADTLEQVFEKRPKGAEQLIGLNEVLDAKHGIDLVDVHYTPEPDGTLQIGLVRFVQVKRGEIKRRIPEDEREQYTEGEIFKRGDHEYVVDDLEVRRNQDAHQAFLSQCALFERHQRSPSVRRAEIEIRRSDTERYVHSGEYFERFFQDTTSLEKRNEFVCNFFKDFIEHLFENVSAEAFDVAKAAQSYDKPLGLIKLYFSNPGSFEIFQEIMIDLESKRIRSILSGEAEGEVEKIIDEEIARLFGALQPAFDRLHAWAKAQPLSHEDLQEVYPEWKPRAPDYFSATQFESVILHGSKSAQIPLSIGGKPRVLTWK